jgi:hypothetical protein
VGNRGSKSVILNSINIAVKEQRVNGSWCDTRVSLVRILTKVNPLLPLRSFYSLAPQESLTLTINPWFVTGLSDAEACFTISIIENKERKIGWRIFHSFQITLHIRDKALLELIQSYFGVGSIIAQRSETVQYRVQSVKDLKIILKHFEKYPLITKKWGNFLLFKQALELIDSKEHLKIDGLRKIIAIKASMNLGLKDELKAAFPLISPENRPSVSPASQA